MNRDVQGYWRDFMASQPLHIEIVGEKNTVKGTIRPVAAEYCIPLTLAHGFSSIPPRYDLAKRFRRSGKEKLLLLIVRTSTPEGEVIATSLRTVDARRLRYQQRASDQGCVDR